MLVLPNLLLTALILATLTPAEAAPPPNAAAGTSSSNGNTPSAPVKRYAVTLLTSFEPIPASMIPKDVTGFTAYPTSAAVFGRNVYFVRLGFFASQAEAVAMKDRLLTRYPAAFASEITEEEYAAVAGGAKAPAPAARPEPAAPVKPTAASSAETLYVVVLATAVSRAPEPAGAIPGGLTKKRLYTRSAGPNGRGPQSLNLGFFATAAEAEAARRLLLANYPQATVRKAASREREESARTEIALTARPATQPTPAPAAAPGGSAQDRQAAELMEKARAALTRGDNAAAVQLLNRVLQLPPNQSTQDAQELVGLAHERNREIAEAKREYNLYLKLYPEGDGAERVRQRLASLETAPTPKPVLKATKKKDVSVTTAYGSWSQYYYNGATHADITTTTGPTVTQSSLTATDQSALITNLDFTGRFRSGDYDNRVVVRDAYTVNFLANTENLNRLYAAYFEIKNKVYDYSGRVGRQPGNSGGVLGRFDGLSMGYSVLPKWRLNVVAGKPAEFNPINSDKQFWGTSLDMGTFAEHWNGNLYYMSQTVDGIIDRQAVGSELRYFDTRGSLLTLVDYDVSYSALNIALLQATWQVGGKDSLNLLIDHRMAPVLQTSNAVIGEANTSISAQLLTMTEDQLRTQAEDRTPTANLVMLGATHSFNSTWQLGGDIKVYNISGTPASGALPASPGTGDVFVYTVQGIATALFTKRDISVLSLSYLSSDSYDGESVSLSNRTLLQDRWTLDLSLRYYQQTDTLGVDMQRYTPTLRLGYRWKDQLTLEAEGGLESTRTTSSTQTEDAKRTFYMIGYRWDF